MDTCMHMHVLSQKCDNNNNNISFNSTIDYRIYDSTHQQKVHNDINTTS